MLWMVAVALADPEASTVQTLHELEWDRAEVVFVAPQLAGGSVEVRAEGARALGRLRREAALSRLADLRDDPEDAVQRAVAEALALTPGSAPVVREWLDTLQLPRRLAERARAERGVAVLLAEALGHQGTAADIDRLVALTTEPWPVGAAAARGLGHLGIRLDPLPAAGVEALARRLGARDPRIVDAAAWALSRVGLEGASDAALDAAWDRLHARSTPETRAWLVRAVWPHLEDARRGTLVDTVTDDPSRLPRVALITALEDDDLPAATLAPWLDDDDPWVRVATLRALGRMTSAEALDALEAHAERAPPHEAAAALAAIGRPDPARLQDDETPAPIRAVLAGLEHDPDVLVALAIDDPQPGVRSAAAAALLDDEHVAGTRADDLLAAPDPAVREVGLEILDRLPEAERVEPLLQHLRVETDELVLHAGLQRLLALHEIEPTRLPVDDRYLRIVVNRGADARSGRTRRLARELAGALGLPTPAGAEADERRELVLPGGEVVEVEGGWPVVAQTRRLRGAVVETSLGTFHIELDPDTAPLAVATFGRLASAGFYDGLIFHRVEPAFVVQTGCPRGDGWGGPGFTFADERSLVPYDAGSVGMARTSEPDTAGSQWFVTTSDQPHLVGAYTRFGEITRGMHVVRRLVEGAVVESVTLERVEP